MCTPCDPDKPALACTTRVQAAWDNYAAPSAEHGRRRDRESAEEDRRDTERDRRRMEQAERRQASARTCTTDSRRNPSRRTDGEAALFLDRTQCAKIQGAPSALGRSGRRALSWARAEAPRTRHGSFRAGLKRSRVGMATDPCGTNASCQGIGFGPEQSERATLGTRSGLPTLPHGEGNSALVVKNSWVAAVDFSGEND